MKAFETPVIEVKKFNVEDILTASSGSGVVSCGDKDSNNNGCYRDFLHCPSDDCKGNVEGPCFGDD